VPDRRNILGQVVDTALPPCYRVDMDPGALKILAGDIVVVRRRAGAGCEVGTYQGRSNLPNLHYVRARVGRRADNPDMLIETSGLIGVLHSASECFPPCDKKGSDPCSPSSLCRRVRHG